MKKIVLLLTLCLVLFGKSISAQTTIFNTPSTDVTEKNKTYLELDFIGHFEKYENGGFQTYGWRGTRGIGKRIEVGANVFYTRNGSDIPFEFQPNVKWQVYKNEQRKLAVSTGAIAYIPLNRAAGTRPKALVYSNVSKEFTKLKGLRTTFGGYKFVGTNESDGTNTGVIVGIEQPLFKRVMFTGDWFSGNNSIGYATPGFTIIIGTNQILGVGYSFGNSGRGNNAFTSYYGISF